MLRRLVAFNLLIVLLCGLVVGLSWQINRDALDDVALKVFRAQGRAAFQLIQTARFWNALRGRVYVPLSEQMPPNPYLTTPDRDITDNLGRALTQVNPAYMTRQIAELLSGSNIELHITSLRPLNPLNRADPWEADTLRQFEQSGHLERVDRVGERYRYMSGLIIEHACMQCHEQHGYRIGDLRGGISVSVPAAQIDLLVADMREGASRTHLLAFLLLSLSAVTLFSLFYLLRAKLAASTQVQEELKELVERDVLTSVLSRRELMNRMADEVERVRRYQTPLTLIMADVDHFKRINDRYGHAYGDRVLRAVAQAMEQTLRSVDMIGRYGGEEFVMLLPNTALNDARPLAERLLQAVCRLSVATETGEVVGVTVSLGLACSQELAASVDGEVLINAADRALYRAKREGRNRACFARREDSER